MRLTTDIAHTNDDIDRACLRVLRCPDPFAVKNRLQEKDKLLYESIGWILRDPQYVSWQDGNNVNLLWIKGGAGKGKTMMSIGLVEQLSGAQHEITVVTYFFCQNADYELNTIEAIIKGLIFRLISQQKDLKECLRRRWDTVNERFNEDITAWRTLWGIFLEMLDHCKSQRIYVIVDALDECQDKGMAELLRLIVRTGLGYHSKIKWLLTSRPLDSAEQELLTGSNQERVSLELNSNHVAEAVKTYAASRAAELDCRQRYGPVLRQKVEAALVEKAEETFLWVSLVCKRLESVPRDNVLATIQELPPGLHPFYDRILYQLGQGDSANAEGCLRLLKVMLLAYRPLKPEEVAAVTGLSENQIGAFIDRCASFIKKRETDVDFVHQSARDYLGGKDGRSILDSRGPYEHGEIALSCLFYLFDQLKVNLMDLPQPNSTRESMKALNDKKRNAKLASTDYAATFWVQHLNDAKHTTLIQNILAEQGKVDMFFRKKLLEWLECLSLLDELPRAIEAFKVLRDIAEIYSSVIVFSPRKSVVRSDNLSKVPVWLKKLPQVEEAWASLIQTLTGHSDGVRAVAFSPDGKQIASGSSDETIKLWDAMTGDLQKPLAGHSGSVRAVAFSPDGRQIASGSGGQTGKQITLGRPPEDRSQATPGWVHAVAFSPDGKQITSGSGDGTIKLWDATTGDLQKTLAGDSGSVQAVAFSPDGKQIASGSDDRTIKLWDATTGDLQKTFAGHSGWVHAVAFSPDGKQIASGSSDGTIKLWDAMTGDLQKTLAGSLQLGPRRRILARRQADRVGATSRRRSQAAPARSTASHSRPTASRSRRGQVIGPSSYGDATTGDLQKMLAGDSGWVHAVAFSPDGKQIASGSSDWTIKLWDAMTGDLQKTLAGHSGWVHAFAFSPDSKQIASGSSDETIKLWDATTGDLQKTLAGHSGWIRAVAFSPDGKQIASGSSDGTIKLWDITKSLKVSQLLGNIIGSRLKFRGCQEIKIPGCADSLRFSRNGRHLVTNLGPIKIDHTLASGQSHDNKLLEDLWVGNQWIHYGAVPVFRLAPDVELTCFDIKDNQVAIGLRNGRVLSFNVDRRSLHLALGEPGDMRTNECI
ncbi:putative G-protein beta WD 40 repeat-containing protein [Cenococcum geophilum 1.58]|uniref:putative G-protein beta WD 40 repeat-containing protein n=1 Tax=Cenococcum geophilum 1.58 TaxID=794803 RepID=UPI0035900CD1|nr:putative G-protein beta WD 40 repeats-containing protein [Cenococcum geophilum 1.58]